ncbi:putative ferric-chelate reductase 1 homolog isoform X1 [Biomphalaria glabrata]|uniref:Ferric-chelate reductase 1 homolog isoform X1 n=1 Tax=Biomphalaria glabrata TaxID=6526 RepID=A0A9W2YTH9_BIOGL|nr:putative ferric-chelate reductase 1 homolog isoform X1 [Biomphalaria glabrata]XP_055865959.1 putative ferric-chelate reductase 1 homolog isoform X1 [Biomphalaria glabrata]
MAFGDQKNVNKTFYINLLCILQLLIYAGEGYPNGAPTSVCDNLLPIHDSILPQTSDVPYTIQLEPDQFKPGDKIKVSIVDPRGKSLKGLVIGAYMKSGRLLSVVGQFLQFPTDKLKPLKCTAGQMNNTLTHSNDISVHNVSLLWEAPHVNTGDVIFRVTLLENFQTFWTDVRLTLRAIEDVNETKPTGQEVTDTVLSMPPIDFESCGDSKGCFLYPRYCSGSGCLAAFTYSYRSNTSEFLFELMSQAEQNYISLGFSKDLIMGGNDETFTCVSVYNTSAVQHGYNPGHYNIFKNSITEYGILSQDGTLQCRFSIPVNTSIQDIEASTVYSHFNETFVQLAWGSAMPNRLVIFKHEDMPPQSDVPINLRERSIHRGSAFPFLVRSHCVLMTVSWVLMCGMAIAISRYFKDFLPDVKVANTKVWFQLHRGLALTIVILTTAGLICVFAHYGSRIRQAAVPHSYVGLAVVTAAYVQMLSGLFRPSLDHPARWVFNWCHRLLGLSIHVLTAATIYLAFKIHYFPRDLKNLGIISVSCWVAIQLVWVLVFEIVSYYKRKQQALDSETQAMLTNVDTQTTSTKLDWLLLTLYVISMLVCCLFIALTFLSY